MAHTADSHDLAEIGRKFPDVATLDGLGENALKELQAKYDIRLRIADQILRERELKLKEGAARRDRWANPLVVGILVAALGLLGNFVNGLWQNLNQQAQLEHEKNTEKTKLQNDLIKEAIKPASEQERAKSLVFFAKNGLITLDSRVIASLAKIAGTDQPVPGSSSVAGLPQEPSPQLPAVPLTPSDGVVTRILRTPGVPYPSDAPRLEKTEAHRIEAIILHDALARDQAVEILRNGLRGGTGAVAIPGPLAHWLVQSDGKIVFIAPEDQRANHVGRAVVPYTNANTIGIEVTGSPALVNEAQTENLVRLVADIADRWDVPTSRILSHAEVALPPGRKTDMAQQAPVVREMVEKVRRKKLP